MINQIVITTISVATSRSSQKRQIKRGKFMQDTAKASAAGRLCDNNTVLFLRAPFVSRALACLCLLLGLTLAWAPPASAATADAPLTIWFDQPANDWERE